MEVKHFLSMSYALHLQHTLNVEKTVLIHVSTKTKCFVQKAAVLLDSPIMVLDIKNESVLIWTWVWL